MLIMQLSVKEILRLLDVHILKNLYIVVYISTDMQTSRVFCFLPLSDLCFLLGRAFALRRSEDQYSQLPLTHLTAGYSSDLLSKLS